MKGGKNGGRKGVEWGGEGVNERREEVGGR